MAFQPAKLPSSAHRSTPPPEQDEGSDDRAKTIKLAVIGTLVVLALVLVVVGMFTSKSGGGGGGEGQATAAGTGNTPTNPQPAPRPEGEARLVTTIGAADPQGLRITFGRRLPFPIPGQGQADIEGGSVVGGSHEWERTGTQPEAGAIQIMDAEGGQVWARVELDTHIRTSMMGKTVDMAERTVPPIMIVDGSQVGAHGFVYEDAGKRAYAFEPMLGLRGLAQAPQLVAGRTDQKLWLLFPVPKGGSIKSVYLGRRKVMEWDPPVVVPAQ